MAVKKTASGEWPTTDEWPSITADVTCRTLGCPAEGVTFRVTLYENVEAPKYRSQCTSCNTPNDDIAVIAEETAGA
jgi:hypothetical protein